MSTTKNDNESKFGWLKWAMNPFFIAVISALLVLVLPLWLTNAFNGFSTDGSKSGQLGDFVGGYLGTAAVILSIGVLWASFKQSRKSEAKLEFERMYFEMLRFHRENTSELVLDQLHGRRIFIFLVRELRLAREALIVVNDRLKLPLSKQDEWTFAYMALFYGIGSHSDRLLKKSLEKFNPQLVRDFVAHLHTMQNHYDSEKILNNNDQGIPYLLFDGHQSRLGHYYRHLFQTVKFVHNSKEVESEQKKYELMRTVRAQLSNYEQVLLLANCLTPLGAPWNNERLLVKYKLVKNIPRDFFASHELELERMFPEGYFEWTEAIEENALKAK